MLLAGRCKTSYSAQDTPEKNKMMQFKLSTVLSLRNLALQSLQFWQDLGICICDKARTLQCWLESEKPYPASLTTPSPYYGHD